MSDTPLPLPAGLRWVKLVCRLGRLVTDSAADVDAHPDLLPVGGTLTLAASPSRVRIQEADGRWRSVEAAGRTYTIRADGELVDNEGRVGVYIPDPSSLLVEPQGYAITAVVKPTTGTEWRVTVGGSTVLPDTVDLVAVSSVGSVSPSVTASFDARIYSLEQGGGVDVSQVVEDYLVANPPAAVSDATATTRGILQLAGDLGGTATAPTVPGLADKADADHAHTAADIDSGAATDGHILTADGAGSATWEAPPAGGGGGGGVTADDTPAAPAEGQSASYLVTSAVTWPAGLVWSDDPDGGSAPTVTGSALVSLFTVGGATRAIMGATFPAVVAPDTTAPAWSATLTAGTPASTSVVVAASSLATDAVGVTSYERSLDSGGSWATIVPNGLNFTLTGLTASTSYPAPRFRAKDAAGNISPVLTAQAFSTVASNFAPSLTLGTATVTDLDVSQPFTTSDTEGSPVTVTAVWGDGDSGVVTSPATHTYPSAGSWSAAFTPNDGSQDGAVRNATYVTSPPASASTILDSFTRANSATSLGVTDTGETWVQVGTGVVGISSNQAYRATSNGFAIVDFGQADMTVTAKIGVNAAYFSAPIARSNAAGTTFYHIDTGSGGGAGARIRKTIDGTEAAVAGAINQPGTVTGDTLGLRCKEVASGTELTLYRNGVALQTVTDAGASRPIGTYAGIRPFNSPALRFDDFRVDPA